MSDNAFHYMLLGQHHVGEISAPFMDWWQLVKIQPLIVTVGLLYHTDNTVR